MYLLFFVQESKSFLKVFLSLMREKTTKNKKKGLKLTFSFNLKQGGNYVD